jgi:hypothetical protein
MKAFLLTGKKYDEYCDIDIDIDIDVKIKFFSLPRQIECREINQR